MSDNPYPVMHGSMYVEPSTLQECINTECIHCAYKKQVKEFYKATHVMFCAHLEVLKYMEEVKL